ncbi:MAG: S8 family serine peptidase [Paludibacteraceae bacterium]|nr:S8 family serine peptidase [Paludibacteraceae bacterium]
MSILKKIFACILMTFMVGHIYAQQSNLSSATKMRIAEYKLRKNRTLRSGNAEEKQDKGVLTTILLQEGKNIPQETLDSLGVKVKLSRGKIIIGHVPLHNLEKLAEIEGIKLIDTGRKVQQVNDKSREASEVDSVHKMKSEVEEVGVTNIPTQYRGKGVLVAVIDNEIDLGHPAFRDENGNSRIRYASITDENGEESVYTEENMGEAIKKAKDRKILEGHGTHVAGIAAGSTVALSENDPMKKFYGMAPEADILTFDNVKPYDSWALLSIGNAFNIADEQKKPIVVNISSGINSAQLDGTDDFNNELSTLLETYDMKGKIICVAAGNDGGSKKSVQIECNQPVESVQKAIISQLCTKQEYISFYGSDARDFAVIYKYYDKNMNLIGQISSPINKECDTIYVLNDTQNDTIIRNIFTRKVTAADRLLLKTTIESQLDSIYVVAYFYSKEEGQKIDGLFIFNNIFEVEDEMYAKPNGMGSLNQAACTDNVISVGSYNTRIDYKSMYGKTTSRPDVTELNGITSFSSYCTSHYGKAKPDVVAPGGNIISALPILYEDTTEIIGKSKYDDSDYIWGVNSGTSMAAPAATGIIALWLQANPNLTTADVRETIRETSTYDSFCHEAADQAGMGKINALKGLEYILKKMGSGIPQTEADNVPANGKYLLPNGKIVIKNGQHLYDATGVKVR